MALKHQIDTKAKRHWLVNLRIRMAFKIDEAQLGYHNSRNSTHLQQLGLTIFIFLPNPFTVIIIQTCMSWLSLDLGENCSLQVISREWLTRSSIDYLLKEIGKENKEKKVKQQKQTDKVFQNKQKCSYWTHDRSHFTLLVQLKIRLAEYGIIIHGLIN